MGYARLARAISEAQMAGEKGAPRTTVDGWPPRHARRCTCIRRRARRTTPGTCSPGCRKGTVPAALVRDGPAAARARSTASSPAFGRDRVLVELWDHGDPLDRHRNDALARVAMRGGGRGDRDQQRPLRDPDAAPAGHRARRGAGPALLDEIDGWLPASPFAHLRSAAEQEPPFRALAGRGGAHRRDRGRVRVRPALRGTGPARLPGARGPHRDDLAARAHRGGARRSPTRPPTRTTSRRLRQIAHELDVIEQLGFPGYFLVLARHRRRSAARTTSTARAGGARRTARSATRSGSPRPTRSRWACSSSGSSHSSATARPTSTSTSSTSGARR